MVKKSTKLPQIAGVPGSVLDYIFTISVIFCLCQFLDDVGQSHGSMQNASGLIIGVCSQQGKRPYQEDEYCVSFLIFRVSTPLLINNHHLCIDVENRSAPL